MLKSLLIFLKKYQIILKITVSACILTIIFRIVNVAESLTVFTRLDAGTILAVILLTTISFVNQAGTWFLCLRLNPTHSENFFSVCKSHTIGMSLRLFLPGGVGTFGKVLYVDQPNKKATFYSIITEKFFIIWSVCFFAFWSLTLLTPKVKILVIFFSVIFSLLPWFIPILLKKHLTAEIIKKYNKTVSKLITTSFFTRIFDFIQYYLVLNSLVNRHISFVQVAMFISIISVANTIPITINGLGLRESAAALLLPIIGVPKEIAVGASLFIFLLNAIIPAIPGAIFLCTAKKQGSSL